VKDGELDGDEVVELVKFGVWLLELEITAYIVSLCGGICVLDSLSYRLKN
jgi:hypothetical protein